MISQTLKNKSKWKHLHHKIILFTFWNTSFLIQNIVFVIFYVPKYTAKYLLINVLVTFRAVIKRMQKSRLRKQKTSWSYNINIRMLFIHTPLTAFQSYTVSPNQPLPTKIKFLGTPLQNIIIISIVRSWILHLCRNDLF